MLSNISYPCTKSGYFTQKACFSSHIDKQTNVIRFIECTFSGQQLISVYAVAFQWIVEINVLVHATLISLQPFSLHVKALFWVGNHLDWVQLKWLLCFRGRQQSVSPNNGSKSKLDLEYGKSNADT